MYRLTGYELENVDVVGCGSTVAENGDIVAAMIEDEATVKVYRRRDDHVELVPRNPRYEVIPADHATILGKVVCVLRRV